MPDDADSRERARRQYWQRRSAKGWRCPGCNRSRSEVDRVDVHHRDGNPNNNDPDNLVALCRRCHLGGQHDRDVDEEHLGPPEPRGTGPPQPRNLDPP
ncbi:HNH endonuclease [Halorussus sp. AFM4]|uniref:HNH endonuclease n=1 Tax=Halorussus sp. AFM4 TaxID=3421651 RepID=UPI003EBC16E3